MTRLALVSQLHYLDRMTTNDTPVEGDEQPELGYDPHSAENIEGLDPTLPVSEEQVQEEMATSSQTMRFLTEVLISEDSPFHFRTRDLTDEQRRGVAETASFMCVFALAHDIKRAGTQIGGESLRSQNPTKANYGKGVSQALNAIADAMLPEVTR